MRFWRGLNLVSYQGFRRVGQHLGPRSASGDSAVCCGVPDGPPRPAYRRFMAAVKKEKRILLSTADLRSQRILSRPSFDASPSCLAAHPFQGAPPGPFSEGAATRGSVAQVSGATGKLRLASQHGWLNRPLAGISAALDRFEAGRSQFAIDRGLGARWAQGSVMKGSRRVRVAGSVSTALGRAIGGSAIGLNARGGGAIRSTAVGSSAIRSEFLGRTPSQR